ncbi:MAG: RluA family pseudouridine synthase [Caldilineaceae bacterium]|nr:RluA family pseudouridine synthase [Caldilineaceae bacterium]MCY4118584.1 RluA family pseudouridine synthase [Caldilineaceae bacterium]
MDEERRAVRHFIVPASAAGQRLDRWLTEQFQDSSRSAVKRWIADGLVQVNGERPAKAGLALVAAAQVEVVQLPPQDTTLQPQEIPLDIIYEDNDLLVIDKQAGLVVHPGPGHAADTLVNAVLHHCPELEGIGGERRPGIVHRLDKGTSGVIVVAKHDAAMHFLQGQFAARTVRKEYVALLEGRIEPPRGRIDAPVGRHPTERQRMTVLPTARGAAGGSGRAAVTDYESLRVYDTRMGGQTVRFSLVRAALHTGRTHQIRVHFAWRRNPVVGDTMYGFTRARLALERPFLHAIRLGIRLPGTEEQRLFEAPLPGDLRRVLDRLGEYEE